MDHFITTLTDVFHLIFHYLTVLEQYLAQFWASLSLDDAHKILMASATSFTLIVAAEIGDKSQLVCMTLATKHRPVPIILGAVAAFAFLNLLAVVFGQTIAQWLPAYVIATIVAILFFVFGIQALKTEVEEEEAEELPKKSSHGIFFTTFLLITIAEFGDKTQLAVVALASTSNGVGVWLGATLALAFTSILGVVTGRALLQRIPIEFLHKIAGVIFLVLSIIAAIEAYQHYRP